MPDHDQIREEGKGNDMTKAQRIHTLYRNARTAGMEREAAVRDVLARSGYRRPLVEYTLRNTFLAERGRNV